MTTQNPILKKLKTRHILKLTVKTVLGLLNLDAGSNAVYSGKQLLYHILSACTSQTSVSHVSEFNDEAPSEGTIRDMLKGLELAEVQKKVNLMLQKMVLRTLPRIPLKFAIDFNEIPFYGEEATAGDTCKSRA